MSDSPYIGNNLQFTLNDGEVTTPKIANGAVTQQKIAAGAVGNTELAIDSVDASKIAVGAVGSSEIDTGAVGTDELGTAVVTAAKMAVNSITEANMDAATAAKLNSSGNAVAGAHVYLTSAISKLGALSAISWAAERYDTNSCWAIGLPTRLIVPASGFAYARLVACLSWSTVGGGADATIGERRLLFYKNGVSLGIGGIIVQATTSFNYTLVTATTGIIPVAGSDYFEVRQIHGATGGDGNLGIGTESFFSIELLN